MPKIKSAKKALRQNVRRKGKNLKKKAVLKKAIKEVKKLMLDKKVDQAKEALSKLYKLADKVSKSNAIAKNKASRIKSRITKLVNKK